MRILIVENPLQFVYWNIRKFLAVVLSIQIALLCVIALESFGLVLPLARPILGFLYIIFIPGSMVLRLLNLRRLSGIELVTYSMGLSIAIVMLLGLSINGVFIVLHVPDPLTITPLLIALGALTSVLCILCYLRDDATNAPDVISSKELLTPSILSVSLLLPVTVMGVYLFNHYKVSIVDMAIIGLLAVLLIIIGFKKHVPQNLYPFALFVMALALLLRNALVSNYLWGADIHLEYYIDNLVVTYGFWNLHAAIGGVSTNAYNIMLSTVILAPIMSNITGLSLYWVFKILYPVIFSFVPLILYVTFKKQTNSQIAFYAAALFATSFIFYTEMFALPRQQIAELFLSLLFLVMISKELTTQKRTVLSLVFGSALVVSHYGTAYYFVYLLLFNIVFFSLRPVRRYINTITRRIAAGLKITLTSKEKKGEPRAKEEDRNAISLAFAVFVLVFAFVWFVYLNGAPFFNFLYTVSAIGRSISSDLFNPSEVQPLGIVLANQGPMQTVTKYLYYLTTFFAIYGLVSVLFKRRKQQIRKTYITLAVGAVVLLIGCTTLPNFAASLNTQRFYGLAMLLLAPFMVIGMMDLFSLLDRVSKRKVQGALERRSLGIVSVFLAVFLLFNSGFVYTLTGEQVVSAAVIATNPDYTYTRWTDGDVAGAAWLHSYKGAAPIYADGYYPFLLASFDQPAMRRVIYVDETPNFYLFTGVKPANQSQFAIYQDGMAIDATKNRDLIFSNGDNRIYY
jgi:uncharacterized membrane protein